MLTPLQASGLPAQDFDTEEIRRAVGVLFDPNAAVELRFLMPGRERPYGQSVHLRGDSEYTEFLRALREHAQAQYVWYTVNPLRLDIGRNAVNDSVMARRWFFLDVDSICATEGQSATDEEKQGAQDTADQLNSALQGDGWPAPVIVDSGNGFHLLYRVNLPNDKIVSTTFQKLLHALSARFTSPTAKVEASVHDAARHAKLPGTWARKGTNTPERPWRLCRFLSIPERIEATSWNVLQATLEALGPTPRKKSVVVPAAPPLNGKGIPILTATGASSRQSYAAAALREELAKVASAPQGQRITTLFAAAAAIGNFLSLLGRTRADIEQMLEDAAVQCGLHLDTGGMAEVQRTLRNGLERGLADPRQVPEQSPEKKGAVPHQLNGTAPYSGKANPESNGKAADMEGQNPKNTGEASPVLEWVCDVVPQKVEWLWPGRIPVGELTTFAGLGGVGKTFAMLDICARVSQGLVWPDGKGTAARGSCLVISGEDSPAKTLVPRLIEMGADRQQVATLQFNVLCNFTLASLTILDRAITEAQQSDHLPLRLLCIDPPTAYCGEVDDHKNAQLRSLLTPLHLWAMMHNVAIVFATHLNKAVSHTEAALRVTGSIAWVNSVRSAFLFVEDRETPGQCLFLNIKSNLAPKPPGLSYKIEPTSEDMAKLTWTGTVDVSANEAIGSLRKARAVSAGEWLVSLFRQKLNWPSVEFWAEAKQAGVSKNAIDEYRLRHDGYPKCRKTTGSNGDVFWTWHVPGDWPPLDEASDCPFN